MEGDMQIPPVDELVEQVKSKMTFIMSQTMVHSKKAARDEANGVNEGLKERLGGYGLEHKGDDIRAATVLGTFHWYSSKFQIPEKADLKPADIPKQSNLKVLEIRRYDAGSGQDTRATILMSTDSDELKSVTEGVSAFYRECGYEALPSWGRIQDQKSEPGTKF